MQERECVCILIGNSLLSLGSTTQCAYSVHTHGIYGGMRIKRVSYGMGESGRDSVSVFNHNSVDILSRYSLLVFSLSLPQM